MFSNKKKWVVTGGAGFIGSHLVHSLLQKGQEVVVFDNFSQSTNRKNIPSAARVFEADVRDPHALEEAFNGADFILHHAALVSVPLSLQQPHTTFEININGTKNVLEAARKNTVKKVIFASSCAVYGNTDKPLCKENDPCAPQSPYAISKREAEKLCIDYSLRHGLETVVLRYFNVFGSGQTADSAYASVIANFLYRAKQNIPLEIDGDGQQTRDFIHVDDIVQANLLAAEKGLSGNIYNVARGENNSILHLAQQIEKISGKNLSYTFRSAREADVRFSKADIRKISALGFYPKISLEEGLKQIWQDKYFAVADNVPK